MAADLDQAGLAGRQDAPGLRIDDAQSHAGQRRALAVHAAIERPIARRHATIAVGFGRAVDVADLICAEFLGGDPHLLGRADHQPGAQAFDALATEFGMPQPRAGHARQGVDGGATAALDQPEPFAGFEAVLQHQRCAMRQGRRQCVGRAVGPEERRRQQHAIIGAEVHALADVETVFDDGAVPQPHRLRPRARPRGVEDQRVILRICAGIG